MTGVVAAAAGLLALALAGCGPDKPGSDAAASGSASPTLGRSSTATASASPSVTPSGSPSSTGGHGTLPPAPPAAKMLTLQVGGGFVGRKDDLTVMPNGDWTLVDGRKGVTRHGTLTGAQRDQLQKLVNSPKLAAEAKLRQPGAACADGFTYKLQVGSVTMMRANCGTTSNTPTFNAVISLLGKATPL